MIYIIVITLIILFLIMNVIDAYNYYSISNADSPGYGDISNANKADDTACKNYCDSTSNCRGATFSGTTCYLKSELSNTKSAIS